MLEEIWERTLYSLSVGRKRGVLAASGLSKNRRLKLKVFLNTASKHRIDYIAVRKLPMKNDNHTRVFGPLSAGCILMLALSACSTSVQGIGSEDSTHGGSGASSSASATSHEKQIVGLLT